MRGIVSCTGVPPACRVRARVRGRGERQHVGGAKLQRSQRSRSQAHGGVRASSAGARAARVRRRRHDKRGLSDRVLRTESDARGGSRAVASQRGVLQCRLPCTPRGLAARVGWRARGWGGVRLGARRRPPHGCRKLLPPERCGVAARFTHRRVRAAQRGSQDRSCAALVAVSDKAHSAQARVVREHRRSWPTTPPPRAARRTLRATAGARPTAAWEGAEESAAAVRCRRYVAHARLVPAHAVNKKTRRLGDACVNARHAQRTELART